MSKDLTDIDDVEEAMEEAVEKDGARTVAVRSLGITRPSVRTRNVRWLVLALIAGLVIGAGVFAYSNQRSQMRDDQAKEAQQVGTERVAELLSYTPTTVTSDLEAELRWLGGDFHDEYAALVEETIAPAATKAGITVKAEVVAAGVEKVTDEAVTLLMFVNVDTTTKEVTTPRLTGSRVRVVLHSSGDDWSIVSFVPLQGAEFTLQ